MIKKKGYDLILLISNEIKKKYIITYVRNIHCSNMNNVMMYSQYNMVREFPDVLDSLETDS